MRAHDHSLLDALQQAGTPEVILKREQRSAIVKLVYGLLPTGFGKSAYFQMLLLYRGSVLLVAVWL